MKDIRVAFSNLNKAFSPENGLRPTLRRCCEEALRYSAQVGLFEVSIYFTDDENIRILNREHRDIDSATDVLSFPLGENGEYDINPESGRFMLGDIMISTEHAYAQAEEYGHTPQREFAFLTVHGMLHLLGYDHIEESDRLKMREAEESVLAKLGILRG